MNQDQDTTNVNALANLNQPLRRDPMATFQDLGPVPRNTVNCIRFSGPVTNHVNVYQVPNDCFNGGEQNQMALQNGQQGNTTTPARKPRAPRKKPTPKAQQPQVAPLNTPTTDGAGNNPETSVVQ